MLFNESWLREKNCGIEAVVCSDLFAGPLFWHQTLRFMMDEDGRPTALS